MSFVISEGEKNDFINWSEKRIELLGSIKKLKRDIQRYKQKNEHQKKKIEFLNKDNINLKLKIRQIIFWGLIGVFIILTTLLTPIIQNSFLQAILSLGFFGFMAWYLVVLSIK